MARRSRKHRESTSVKAQRDARRIPKDGVLRAPSFFMDDERRRRLEPDPSRDRRFWRPDFSRLLVAERVFDRPAKKTASKSRRGSTISSLPIAYHSPKKVLTCQRRSRRRTSLFAFGHIGRGKGVKNFNKRKYTEDSSIRC